MHKQSTKNRYVLPYRESGPFAGTLLHEPLPGNPFWDFQQELRIGANESWGTLSGSPLNFVNLSRENTFFLSFFNNYYLIIGLNGLLIPWNCY